GSRCRRSRADRSLSREPDDAVPDLDQAVTSERVDRLGVELRKRLLGGGNEAQRSRSPLPEGAFEPRLLPQWLVAPAARGAAWGQRADRAARDARQADGRSEIHQRLAGGRGELVPCALLDAADVRVDGEDGAAEGEAGHRGRGVRPDTRQLLQVVGPP